MPDPVLPTPDPNAPPAAPPATPPAAAPDSNAPPAGTPPESAPAGDLLPGEFTVPEKFLVKKEDGSMDWEGIGKKAIAGFSWAEKKIGSGEIPPEKEDGYTLDYKAFPEGIRVDAEKEKGFLKMMHGLGMTNKQAQGVIDKYAGMLTEGLQLQGKNVDADYNGVLTDVQKEWGEQAPEKKAAVNAAFRALADDRMKADADKIGKDLKATHRALLSVLAKVGADYQEDNPPVGETTGSGEAIEELQKSKAYWDPTDPQHETVNRKVKEYYSRKYAEKK